MTFSGRLIPARAIFRRILPIFLLLPLFLQGALQAQPAVVLDDSQGEYAIGRNVAILEDKEKKFDIREVASPEFAGRFQPSQTDTPNFGFSSSAYWLRFTVTNHSAEKKKWLLEVSYPILDSVKFFSPTPSGAFDMKEAGDLLPFDNREFKHRNLVFILNLAPGAAHTFFMRVEAKNSINIPLTVWSPSAFAHKDHHEQFVLGLYYGIILVMILYNLFVFFSLRDVSYIYYVFFIAFFGLYQMCMNGLAFEYFWPGFPWWADRATVFSIGAFVAFANGFSKSFLLTKQYTPKLDKTLVFFIFSAVVLAVAALFADLAIASVFVTIHAILATVFVISSGVFSMIEGYKPARYFLIAWTLFLCSGMLMLMRAAGLLPNVFVTQYGTQIGSALLVTLLSLGLAYRINMIKQERAEAQAEALKNQKLAIHNLRKADEMKDEFLANTSHELRTPLNGIIGIAESLVDGAAGDLAPKTKYNLSLIVSSGRRLANLVNDILDFSRLKNKEIDLQIKPTNLYRITQIVLALSSPLVAEKPLELKNDIPKGIGPVLADKDRLQQILINLVGNAIKFTESGTVTLSAREQNGMTEIAITDTGIGIPESKLEEIFKSFEQADTTSSRKYGGTGLGLSITKQLVELHGGTINVKSQEGKGSCFTFTLQRTDRASLPQQEQDLLDQEEKLFEIEDVRTELRESVDSNEEEFAQTPQSQAMQANKMHTVLVVDDEPVNLQVLANILTLYNYSVLQAENGQTALDLLEARRPDLILLDVMMPNMNGYDVCRLIREKHPANELPVLMLTAKNQVSNLVEGLNAGANDYIAKPFSKNELLSRIKTQLYLAKLNTAYGRFVPRQLLRYLGKESIVDVELGDQTQRDMAIVFSDIRAFSSLSETMTPKENFDFINSYLRRMGPIIRKYNGFIDKYIGDAIMSLFPLKTEDALDAAIEMQKALREYNFSRIKRGFKPLKVGTGIHTGSMMLGTIGEAERMQGTVISDAVNLAARLEGVTKIYDAAIIVSGPTIYNVSDPNKYKYRMLGVIQVKGKQEPATIFEILDGDAPDLKELKMRTRENFEHAVHLFLNKKFSEAAEHFEKVLSVHPEDKTAKLNLERCRHFEKAGAGADWKGVISPEVK